MVTVFVENLVKTSKVYSLNSNRCIGLIDSCIKILRKCKRPEKFTMIHICSRWDGLDEEATKQSEKPNYIGKFL